MRVHVFNVEHGACAWIQAEGRNVLVDCGHNSTRQWYPGTYLKRAGLSSIDALFITNYDEDHVSGIINLFDHVHVPRVFRNMSVSPREIRTLKSEDGMGRGIEFLVDTLDSWSGECGFGDIGFHTVGIETFFNSPREFNDENNLSLATYFDLSGVGFLFTGDLEIRGWEKLLERPSFREMLAKVDVFFASHHGRESGCCADVFQYCRPTFTVISDKAKGYQTQETTDWYRARTLGGFFNGVERRVLTTRRDRSFYFDIYNGEYNVVGF